MTLECLLPYVVVDGGGCGFEKLYWPTSVGGAAAATCCLRRQKRKKMAVAAMAMTARPPTTPPTMAPIGVEGEGDSAAGLEVAGLLEVLVEEESLGVGVEVVTPGRGIEVVIAAPDLNLAQWEENEDILVILPAVGDTMK